MTLTEKRADFTEMLLHLLNFAVKRAKDYGVLLYVKEVERHKCAQALVVNEGTSWTYNSMHLTGLAVDIIINSADSKKTLWDHRLYDEMAVVWVGMGGEWGGEPQWEKDGHRDRDHYQYNLRRRLKYLGGNKYDTTTEYQKVTVPAQEAETSN